MAIVDFNEDLNIISALSDTPNDYLTAAELKGKFDEGPGKIKTFINEKIVPAIAALEGLFEDGKIKPGVIDDGEITTSMLSDGAVTEDKIASGAVIAAKIASGAVTPLKISDSAVTTTKLANGAVTHSKIGENAVQSDNIIQGAIKTIKIADSAVATPKIYPKAVTTAKLADSAVTTDKLADGAVTTDKIADEAVTLGKTDFVKTTVEDEDTSVPTGKAVKAFVQEEIALANNILVIGMNTLADGAWGTVNTAYNAGKAVFAYTYGNKPKLYELVDCYEDSMIGYEEKDFIFRSITASNASGASISTRFLKRIGNGVSYEYEWSDGGTVSLAPLASPTFTGTPAAPTAASGTNTTQIATTAFVKGEVDDVRPLIINWDTDDKEGMYIAVNNAVNQREILIRYAVSTGTSVFLHYVGRDITNINVTYYFAGDVDTFNGNTAKITKTRHYGARLFAQSNDGITWTYKAWLDSYDINAT